MNCQNQISYLIRPGDTLYNIAAHYGTTVENIVLSNPHLNIYNLRTGELITFCIDKDIADVNGMYQDGGQADAAGEPDNEYVITLPELDLNNDMRMLFSEHCFFTKMLMLSIFNDLKDRNVILARLKRLPKNFAALYKNYYGGIVSGNIEKRLLEQIQYIFDFIREMKNGNGRMIGDAEKKLYSNAEDISRLFSNINPFYTYEEMDAMLKNLLDMLKQETALQNGGNYEGDMNLFDNIHLKELEAADMLTNGIINQFPDAFF